MNESNESATTGGRFDATPGRVASPEVEIQPNQATVTTVANAAPADASVASSVSSRPSSRTETPATTARSARKKKKTAGDKIGKGRRVFCKKRTLFHILATTTEEGKAQRTVLQGMPPGTLIYGTVESGSGKQGYKVAFDLFPHGQKEVVILRKQLKLVADGADEPEFEYAQPPDEEGDGKRKRLTPEQESIKAFTGMEKGVIEKATVFNFAYGKEAGEKIAWRILADDEHVTDMPFDPPVTAEYKADIPWDTAEEKDYNQVFFDHFFPSIKGHGKIIDEYLSDPRAKWHRTVTDDNIKFHDPDAPDPDWKVRVCYTLIIAAASEVEVGVENLWKHGASGGRHQYPDFGRYMPINQFRAFQSAAAMCWCDREFWYQDKDDNMKSDWY